MPSFYPSNNTVLPGDDELRTLHKIASAGGTGGGAGLSGTGSPEGAVTASPGSVYTDVSNGSFWNKVTGTGTTGWQQLVA